MAVRSASGQTGGKLLGTGAWSKPVTDEDHTLRGRLVVYDEHGDMAEHARVYLELQHIFRGGWPLPLSVRYQVGGITPAEQSLHFEVRDRRGRPVPQYTDYSDRSAWNISPYWIALPCDSMIRLRADHYTMGMGPRGGFLIDVENGVWLIPPHHGPVYLSGTFTPLKDSHRYREDHYLVWQSPLVLPPVKIPVP